MQLPPGQTNAKAMGSNLKTLVSDAGELGCHYEATQESWYRFLVDLDPYENIVVEDGFAVLSGTDTFLLAQREDFLRPNSLLTVVVISDENDCSIRDGGPSFRAAQTMLGSGECGLQPPRAARAINPNDPCCRSCQ